MSTQDPAEFDPQQHEPEAPETEAVPPSEPVTTVAADPAADPSEPGEGTEVAADVDEGTDTDVTADVEEHPAPEQTDAVEPAMPDADLATTPPPPGVYGQMPQPGINARGQEYASWIGRVGAYLVDAIPVLILGWIANLIYLWTGTTESQVVATVNGQDILAEVTHGSATGEAIRVVIAIVILLYWFWNKGYREGTTGKSIGKQLLGYTTVGEATGEPIGAKSGCIRVLLLWVDFVICYIGVLWPLWDTKRQTLLSDRFTSAVVYKD